MDSSSPRRKDTPDGSQVFPNSPSSMADNMEIEEYDASPSARATPMAVEETPADDDKKQMRPTGSRQNSAESDRGGPSPTEMKCITSYRPRHYSEGEGQDDYIATKRRFSYKSFSLERDQAIDAYGFVQLDVLIGETSEDKKEWREIARWIKYEEDLEEGSDRLGKPHIAPLSFHYLVKLSHLIERNSVLLLDLEETDISGITKRIAEHLLNKGLIQAHEVGPLMKDLLLQHRRVEETERSWFGSKFAPDGALNEGPYRRSLTNANEASLFAERRPSIVPRRVLQMMSFSSSRSLSLQNRSGSINEDGPNNTNFGSPRKSEAGSMSDESLKFLQQRRQSIKHFPLGAETTMIMVRGEHMHKKGAFVFVRLPEATLMSDITQFPVATRILILLLAPCGKEDDFIELGRSVGTLMSNKKFYDASISASVAKDLVSGINNFLDETIVLPPGDWYNSNFYDLFPIHVLQNKSNLIHMRNLRHLQKIALKPGGDSFVNKAVLDVVPEIEVPPGREIPGPFERTGKPFGGLINDIKRRYPFYWSDWSAGFNMQCVAACIFLYFAAIAHNITFGGILNNKTKGNIGVTETVMAASVSGMIFAAFAGQPLLCIAPTGPLLVFDEILYNFLERHDIEFLPGRVWISIWVVLICLVVLYFEGSRFVRLFTRFTQETFACLISVIFVYESFHSLAHTFKEHPLVPDKNVSASAFYLSDDVVSHLVRNDSIKEGAHSPKNEPNTALLCTFLMLGTFYIAISLKHIRTSVLFGNRIRNFLSDFAVPISIFLMVSVDYWAGEVFTVKIKVPPGFQPTRPHERGWIISPFGIKKPFDPWVPVIMILPGILVFILVFMTVEICELIIGKKPKVDKGCGFHLDPLILAFSNLLLGGFLGTCWVSCATLKALAHLSALTVWSKNNPPGEEPKIVMVLEQRLSAFVMSIFLGLSILMAPALQYVSMAVLFGVFLYMGISSLNGNQLFDRFILFFTPTDSHPQQVEYVRRVPTWKIHMYTLIQIGLLAVLWGVKSIKEIALTFPFVLMMLIPIRLNLNRIFTENELDALDGDPKTPAVPVEERKNSTAQPEKV